MRYLANARMYSVNPQAASAWKELFGWLSGESGVALEILEHAFPLPLSELWSRADLGCAFMCGFPFARARHPPRPLAAPVPVNAPIAGRPLYATHLLVRADSGYFSLEDTFGQRVGYTVEDSHSGYNALRHHLLPYFRQRGAKLFHKSVGPLATPRRVIDALLASEIDVGPLDSYALDLMLRHQKDLAPQIRIVATTDPAPIPFLVASLACPDEVILSLQETLFGFAGACASADLKDRLCLSAFAPVAIADYGLTTRWDAEARAAGYLHPA